MCHFYSYAILINGEASNFFKSSRGLRQGCPLSPLLFILFMEFLSLSLKKAQVDGMFIGDQGFETGKGSAPFIC
jgi:hypothetical protein